MAKKLTSKKAKEILHDKSVHGHPLTDKQRKFFGAIASGAPVKAQKGKKVIIDGKEYDTSDPAYKELYKWGDNPEGKGSIGYFDKEDRLVTSKTTLPEVVIWPKDKKTQKFYDELNDSEQYAFEQMTKKYGPVKVKEEKGSGIFSKTSGHYNPFTNTITINPKTFLDKFDVYISELAHKKQFDEQGKFDVIGDWIFNDIPAYTKKAYYNILEDEDKALESSPYETPGTVEYEAHRKYQPELEDESYKYLDEEQFGENYNKFKTGGWLDKYEYGGQAGYTDIPFKYNSAWGGQFAMGGSLPGSVGFTYARTQGIPSEGPYAKKTMPSAQFGFESDKRKFPTPLSRESVDKYQKEYDEFYTPPKYYPSDDYFDEFYQNLRKRSPNITTVGPAWELSKVKDPTQTWITEGEELSSDDKRRVEQGKIKAKFIKDYSSSERDASMDPYYSDLTKYLMKSKDYPSKQENGGMTYYQHGLDWKPKTISRDGSVIKDDRGQWAHPGEITEIDSNEITMQGVPYPVLGISDEGDTKMMFPEQEYKFKGKKVTEYPLKKSTGGWLDKY